MQLRLAKRCDGLLEAWDDESMEALKKVAPAEYMVVEYKIKRNLKNHKRWFAFVNHTFEMQDSYDDKETWRGCLQIAGGHCKTVVDKKGNTHIWPMSIAWSVFDDEDEFKSMFKRALRWFLMNYGKGMSEKELLRIIDFEPFR